MAYKKGKKKRILRGRRRVLAGKLAVWTWRESVISGS